MILDPSEWPPRPRVGRKMNVTGQPARKSRCCSPAVQQHNHNIGKLSEISGPLFVLKNRLSPTVVANPPRTTPELFVRLVPHTKVHGLTPPMLSFRDKGSMKLVYCCGQGAKIADRCKIPTKFQSTCTLSASSLFRQNTRMPCGGIGGKAREENDG